MSAPNIANVVSLIARTATTNVITNTTNVIANQSGSNSVVKVDNIILTNYSSSGKTANVILSRASGDFYIGGSISIPATSVLVLLGKDISVFLEEGDTLKTNASANSSVHLTCAYETLS